MLAALAADPAGASVLSLARGQRGNRVHQPLGVRRRIRNLRGANHSKDTERVTTFAVATRLALPSGALQARSNRIRRHFFYFGVLRKIGPSESFPKELFQAVYICKKPRFHTLDHEMHIVVVGVVWPLPPISLLQVRPWIASMRDGILAVHQQQYRTPLGLRLGQLGPKLVKRLVSRATCMNPRHPTGESSFLEELAEPLATIDLQLLRVPPSLNVYSDAHQRLPPMSPDLHSSPSR